MTIWLSGFDRTDMIANQRQINAGGSMQAVCLLSGLHLAHAIDAMAEEAANAPALIVFDYDMLLSDHFAAMESVRESPILAGVPIFFAVSHRSEELDEVCYEKGAVVVVHKQFSRAELLRVENTAWRFENTRQFEQKMQAQAAELHHAKEIFRLNTQLSARNELLHKVFGRYFSDDVVDVILEHPDEVSLGGEKRRATILITDLRGFTAISETLSPEALSTMLNYYFAHMVDAILTHHGTVIEFMGDGLLAVFGALLHNTTHQTQHALRAAIAMQNAMRKVNDYCAANGFPALEMGIGLHVGDVFVGNIGSERIMRYNVIGSSVNICSRIEACTVGGQILGSRDVLDAADCAIRYDRLGDIRIKGSAEAIALYDITGLPDEPDYTLCDHPAADAWQTVANAPRLCLYPMDGKVILPDGITASVIAVSARRLRVRLAAAQSSAPKLFDSVALALTDAQQDAADTDGGETSHSTIPGWYAKITATDADTLTLHMTQTDDAARQWIAALVS